MMDHDGRVLGGSVEDDPLAFLCGPNDEYCFVPRGLKNEGKNLTTSND